MVASQSAQVLKHVSQMIIFCAYSRQILSPHLLNFSL